MSDLSKNAEKIFKMKYAKTLSNGNQESWEQQYMQIADSLRIIAVQNAMEGNRQARIAIQERHRADSTAIVAFQNHNEAVRQKIIAEQQRILAQQQSRLAKEEHQKVLELEKKLNQLKNN